MADDKLEFLLPLTKESASRIPSTAGVYLFMDKNRVIKYVGKSVNLKARILSHIENARIDAKEKAIIETSSKVQVIITDSEFKALLLESSLIQKYHPQYNILWKDDKSYLYIKITTKEDYPKIYPIRREHDGKSRYFGPFPSLKVVNELLREIRRVFPFCTQHRMGKTPCFYSKLGLCYPCPNIVNQLTDPIAKKQLKGLYRSNIRRIIRVFEGNTELVLKDLYKELKSITNDDQYENALTLRNKIYRFERFISMPLFSDNIETDHDRSAESIGALRKLLIRDFPDLTSLHRIECYDMSNISFTDSTASMVVLTDGLIDKTQYRKFKIKNEKANSDFIMIEEVIQRRFKNRWEKPDLIVIDGGRPQVRTVQTVLRNAHVDIPLIGIAKHPDRFILGVDNLPMLRPPVQNLGFNLIRGLRDESHRFAKKYHLYLREQKYKIRTKK